jgi:hypothetical protein
MRLPTPAASSRGGTAAGQHHQADPWHTLDPTCSSTISSSRCGGSGVMPQVPSRQTTAEGGGCRTQRSMPTNPRGSPRCLQAGNKTGTWRRRQQRRSSAKRTKHLWGGRGSRHPPHKAAGGSRGPAASTSSWQGPVRRHTAGASSRPLPCDGGLQTALHHSSRSSSCIDTNSSSTSTSSRGL